MTDDQQQAEKVLVAALEFAKGCGNTIAPTRDPWACAECATAFMNAVRRAMGEVPITHGDPMEVTMCGKCFAIFLIGQPCPNCSERSQS